MLIRRLTRFVCASPVNDLSLFQAEAGEYRQRQTREQVSERAEAEFARL